MGDDYATVALTRKTWAGVFLGQLSHLYSIVLERNAWDEGSDQWRYYQRSLREAINTYMLPIKEACMIDPAINKEWYDFKLAAGIFPKDLLVDNARQLVNIVPATAAD